MQHEQLCAASSPRCSSSRCINRDSKKIGMERCADDARFSDSDFARTAPPMAKGSGGLGTTRWRCAYRCCFERFRRMKEFSGEESTGSGMLIQFARCCGTKGELLIRERCWVGTASRRSKYQEVTGPVFFAWPGLKVEFRRGPLDSGDSYYNRAFQERRLFLSDGPSMIYLAAGAQFIPMMINLRGASGGESVVCKCEDLAVRCEAGDVPVIALAVRGRWTSLGGRSRCLD